MAGKRCCRSVGKLAAQGRKTQEGFVRYLTAGYGMLAIDHSMVGSVPVKISGRCRVPSATGSGHAPAVTGESVCTPGHWRLVRGTEFITPRRRSYGKVCIQGGWSRFSG